MDLEKTFGREKRDLGNVFNATLDWIYDNHCDSLYDITNWWMEEDMLQSYADAVKQKGAPLDNCIGFIDGS